MVQFLSMSRILIALGALLMGWGAVVLVRGDFVATLDIGASLISSGVVVVALSAIVRALNGISERLGDRPAVVVPQQASPPVPVRPVAEPVAPAQTPTRPTAPEAVPGRAESPAAPVVVREGDIEGRRYRFFSDGSIEADGPNGLRRYRSLDEAREQIMRDRGEMNVKVAPLSEPPARSEASARPQPDRPVSPHPPSPRVSRGDEKPPAAEREPSAAAKTAREPVSWETYLASGRAAAAETKTDKPSPSPAKAEPPGDDEWSEPFRMLLKGSAPETPEPSKPEDKRR